MKILNANPALIPVKSISPKQTFKEGTEKREKGRLEGQRTEGRDGENEAVSSCHVQSSLAMKGCLENKRHSALKLGPLEHLS